MSSTRKISPSPAKRTRKPSSNYGRKPSTTTWRDGVVADITSLFLRVQKLESLHSPLTSPSDSSAKDSTSSMSETKSPPQTFGTVFERAYSRLIALALDPKQAEQYKNYWMTEFSAASTSLEESAHFKAFAQHLQRMTTASSYSIKFEECESKPTVEPTNSKPQLWKLGQWHENSTWSLYPSLKPATPLQAESSCKCRTLMPQKQEYRGL